MKRFWTRDWKSINQFGVHGKYSKLVIISIADCRLALSVPRDRIWYGAQMKLNRTCNCLMTLMRHALSRYCSSSPLPNHAANVDQLTGRKNFFIYYRPIVDIRARLRVVKWNHSRPIANCEWLHAPGYISCMTKITKLLFIITTFNNFNIVVTTF